MRRVADAVSKVINEHRDVPTNAKNEGSFGELPPPLHMA